MSGRNLCIRAVERCKSCWFLFNQRLVTPRKVGCNNVCAFPCIFLYSRDAMSAVIDPSSAVRRTCVQSLYGQTSILRRNLSARINIESGGINLLTEYVSWAEYINLYELHRSKKCILRDKVPSLSPPSHPLPPPSEKEKKRKAQPFPATLMNSHNQVLHKI